MVVLSCIEVVVGVLTISENEGHNTSVNKIIITSTEQLAGVSSIELTFENNSKPNFSQPSPQIRKIQLRDNVKNKNLVEKNTESGDRKQAGLSSVNNKIKTKQHPAQDNRTKNPKTNNKINKIDKYLVKLRKTPNQMQPSQANQPNNPNNQPTHQTHNPTQLSLMEKIRKFSSNSPPKLPSTTPKETNVTKHHPVTTTIPKQQPTNNNTSGTETMENNKQHHKQEDNSTSNLMSITNTRTTTTSLMEVLRMKNKLNKNKTTTTTPKPAKQQQKQANKSKNPNTEPRSLTRPDIKLYLAKKKVEIEARAAANVPPTQARDLCNLPSNNVTSARSIVYDDPGETSGCQTKPDKVYSGREK